MALMPVSSPLAGIPVLPLLLEGSTAHLGACRKAATTLVKMVVRCARELAPAIIYIGECEKVRAFIGNRLRFAQAMPGSCAVCWQIIASEGGLRCAQVFVTDKRKIKTYGFQEPPGRIRISLLAEVRQDTNGFLASWRTCNSVIAHATRKTTRMCYDRIIVWLLFASSGVHVMPSGCKQVSGIAPDELNAASASTQTINCIFTNARLYYRQSNEASYSQGWCNATGV